ncbi:MAG: response regulator transcription factor [Chloroflexi bacterium]|nr:response regulator transcription factor [Chloroflexota bacterium]
MTEVIKVLVVDDQELFREIARTMFEITGEFTVVAEASDGLDAVSAYIEHSPDLVLMDIQMARMNGIEATRKIRSHDPSASVILISMKADPEYQRVASQIGAVGFIAKRDLDPSTLKSLIDDSLTKADAA